MKGVLNFNSQVWAVIFDNQIITGWLIAGTWLLKTLSGHSFRVKKNLQAKVLLISNFCGRKFQITAVKDLPYRTIMTKLKLFHVVERKMYHAGKTFKINCHL